MKDIRRGLWLIAIGISMLLSATYIHASDDENVLPQSEWVKGGVLIGRSSSGNCMSRPFVKVGEAEDNRDDGKPQILGFEPGNVHVNSQGHVIWERVYEERFAERNHPYKVTACRCPPYSF